LTGDASSFNTVGVSWTFLFAVINGLTQNGVFCSAGFAFSMGKQPFEQGLDSSGTVQGKQSTSVHIAS
jgi:hypothetical protein